MTDSCDAYIDLELIAESEFRKHNVSLFCELPSDTQKQMLKKQEEILKKHNVTREDFNNPTPYIAAD
jgi:hypothetical protein